MANFHSLGKQGQTPATGIPGDVYFHKGVLFIALPDGRLTPLNRLLSDTHTLGIMLARGEKGDTGAPGKDSTVPGPKGDKGDKGERGEKGDRGDVAVVGDAELLAAVNKLKAQKAAALAIIVDRLSHDKRPAAALAKQHLLAVKKALEN